MFQLDSSDLIFQHRVEGVSIYHLLRFQIELDLRVAGSPYTLPKLGLFKKALNWLRRTIERPKLRERKRQFDRLFTKIDDVLPSRFLFVSPSNYVDAEGVGPHLIEVIRYYHSKGNRINFVQRRNVGTNGFPGRDVCYESYLPLEVDVSEVIPGLQKDELQEFLAKVSKLTAVDYTVELVKYYQSLARSLAEAKQLKSHIEKTGCKYVFSYSVYTEPWITMACRLAGVALIEVQHGVILPDSVYYQSPRGHRALENYDLLMPDFILTLGREWSRILVEQNSFYSEENIMVLGRADFERWRSLAATPQKPGRSRRLTFFLQGRSFNGMFNISEFIVEFVKLFGKQIRKNGWEIAVRPHPNDRGELTELAKKSGTMFGIEDPADIGPMESIASSDCIFAASSMCLYEAISLGKMAVSLHAFAGILIEKDVNLVRSPAELFDLILHHQPAKNGCIPYLESFKPATLDKISSLVA